MVEKNSNNPNNDTISLANSAQDLSKEIIYDSIDNDNGNSSNVVKTLKIIHFNDVYNVDPNNIEPKAGAARFLTAVNYLKQEHPCLVLFSGDCFSPSSLSLITKGQQMLPILNKLEIGAACIGNHDFDFGLENLIGLINSTNFPWLMSNCCDVKSRKPLADAHIKHIMYFNGIKIGFVGLVEKEWIETITCLNDEDIIYESYVDVGRKLAIELREQDKVDIVIALTHMRFLNDKNLIEEVKEIDLVLGGHDHHYHCELVNDEKWIIKSGTDFREFSLISVNIEKNQSNEVRSSVSKIERFVVDSKVPEDEEIKSSINFYMEQSLKGLDKVIGHIDVDLDGRFSVVRSSESNLGNFICDITLNSLNADCVVMNSGTLRSDCLTPKGDFTIGDLKKIIPYADTLVLLRCSGKKLHQVLENSVSQYPKLEGRFPQVSGLEFAFDPRKPPGHRVDPRFVKVQNEYLELEKDYKLASKMFMKQGKDGYSMLMDCHEIIGEEEGPLLFTIVENYFNRIKSIENNDINGNTELAQRICPQVEGRITILRDQQTYDYLMKKRNRCVNETS